MTRRRCREGRQKKQTRTKSRRMRHIRIVVLEVAGQMMLLKGFNDFLSIRRRCFSPLTFSTLSQGQ